MDGAPVKFRYRKAEALTYYLALEPGRHPRARERGRRGRDMTPRAVATGFGLGSGGWFGIDVVRHVTARDPVPERGRLPLEGPVVVGCLKRVGSPLAVD